LNPFIWNCHIHSIIKS